MDDQNQYVRALLVELALKVQSGIDYREIQTTIEEMTTKIGRASTAMDRWLTASEVVDLYPFFASADNLAQMRSRGQGPEWTKPNKGKTSRVYYQRKAVENWLIANQGLDKLMPQYTETQS